MMSVFLPSLPAPTSRTPRDRQHSAPSTAHTPPTHPPAPPCDSRRSASSLSSSVTAGHPTVPHGCPVQSQQELLGPVLPGLGGLLVRGGDQVLFWDGSGSTGPSWWFRGPDPSVWMEILIEPRLCIYAGPLTVSVFCTANWRFPELSSTASTTLCYTTATSGGRARRENN